MREGAFEGDCGHARVREAGFATVAIAIWDGARSPRFGKHFVAAPSIHTSVVNRSASELFLVQFIFN
jgi:hypothetical protein